MSHFHGYDWNDGTQLSRAGRNIFHAIRHGQFQFNRFPGASSSPDVEAGAHFCFVWQGVIRITSPGHCADAQLRQGQYFVAREVDIDARDGACIVVSRIGHDPMFMVGGPVESSGRLRYIDGCTDSLLIPPIKKGDPCLNLLVFPPGIDQTAHTHPSDRIGVVYSGSGECVTPDGVYPLTSGQLFRIPKGGQHKFRTSAHGGMRVIAYHPDSDFGPEDHFHPMINRTMVEGVSANSLPDIQTK